MYCNVFNSTLYGKAIYAWQYATDVKFSNNYMLNFNGAQYGAIDINMGRNAVFNDNVIDGAGAKRSISCYATPNCEIKRNIITNCYVGIDIPQEQQDYWVQNNYVSGCTNSALHFAHANNANDNSATMHFTNNVLINSLYGIFIGEEGSQTWNAHIPIDGNTIYNNTYGVWVDPHITGTILKNNIIANNANFGIGLSGAASVTYNDVWGNNPDYSGVSGGVGSISQNPLFVNESSGNFHLKSQWGRYTPTGWVTDSVTSPAIGAGDPTSDNSKSPWGGTIEMGAYGNTGEASKSYSGAVMASLNTPSDKALLNNQTILFSCSASSGNNLTNITLYGNWSYGWHANETKPLTGTYNSTTFTKTLSNGTYRWNCKAYDSSGNFSFAVGNYTFTIDTSATTTTTSTSTTTTSTTTSTTSASTSSTSTTTISTTTTTTLPTNASAIAVWHFDEGTGTIAYDSSGTNNDGIINGALWTAGKLGSALLFDGTDHINAGNSTSLNLGSGPFTIEFWLRPNDINRDQFIISKSGDNFFDGFGITIQGGNIYGYFPGTGSEVASAIVPNVWTHWAFVRNSAGNIVLYRNASIVYSATSSANLNVVNNLEIGGRTHGNYQWYLNGTIDEVKIYNRALSSSEILAEYQAGNVTATTSTSTTSTTTSSSTTTTSSTTTSSTSFTTSTSSTTISSTSSTTPPTTTSSTLTTTTTSTTLPICTVKGDLPPCDGLVDDWELLDYIREWAKGLVMDFDLLQAIKTWATIHP